MPREKLLWIRQRSFCNPTIHNTNEKPFVCKSWCSVLNEDAKTATTISFRFCSSVCLLNSHFCIYSSQYFAHSARNTRYCIYIKANMLNRLFSVNVILHILQTQFLLCLVGRSAATFVCMWYQVCTCFFAHADLNQVLRVCLTLAIQYIQAISHERERYSSHRSSH